MIVPGEGWDEGEVLVEGHDECVMWDGTRRKTLKRGDFVGVDGPGRMCA